MKKYNEIQLLNIVAFCALMQNTEGVVSKSPDYILEKFEKYAMQEGVAYHWGLDRERQDVVREWAKKWLIKSLKQYE